MKDPKTTAIAVSIVVVILVAGALLITKTLNLQETGIFLSAASALLAAVGFKLTKDS